MKSNLQLLAAVLFFWLLQLGTLGLRGQSKPLGAESNTNFNNAQLSEGYVDPLFFNDGQLCQHLREIFQDSKGNLWFGTNVYDLMRYDGKKLLYLREEDGFSGGRVTEILEDKQGNIWIASGMGLNKFDGEKFQIFGEKEGLANAEIWSLMLDSKGIFWIGHNEGLSKFDGQKFENISVPKPTLAEVDPVYSENRITAICQDSSGDLWLGTDGYGVCKYDGVNFSHYTKSEGLAANSIHDLLIDSKGKLWIGSYWGGLNQFDGKQFTHFSEKNGIQGVEIGAFFEEENGDLWFASENQGVYQYDGKTFQNYHKETGLNGSILSIYKDRDNRFWFGGWGGLFRLKNGSFSVVNKDGDWE